MGLARRARHAAEWAAVAATGAVIRCLPLRVALRVAGWLGSAAFHLAPRRLASAAASVRCAFPDNAALQQRLAKKAFQHLFRVAAALLHLPRLAADPAAFVAHHVDRRRVDPAFAADLAAGAGVVLATGHLGAWELLALALHDVGVPDRVQVYKPLHNAAVDAMVLSLRSSAPGIRMVSTLAGMAPLRASLTQGGIAGLVADQRPPDGARAVDVVFLGKPARAFAGIGALHAGCGAPVWFCALTFNKRKSERLFSLTVQRVAARDEDVGVVQVVQRFHDALGSAIAQAPDQYLWLHSRWR